MVWCVQEAALLGRSRAGMCLSVVGQLFSPLVGSTSASIDLWAR